MGEITLLHNSSCSKSKVAFTLLESLCFKFNTRDYMNNPLTKEEIKDLVQKLDVEVTSIIRTKEPIFIAEFADKEFSDEEWYEILAQHPILIQRPIITHENNGVIAREYTKTEQFLKNIHF